MRVAEGQSGRVSSPGPVVGPVIGTGPDRCRHRFRECAPTMRARYAKGPRVAALSVWLWVETPDQAGFQAARLRRRSADNPPRPPRPPRSSNALAGSGTGEIGAEAIPTSTWRTFSKLLHSKKSVSEKAGPEPAKDVDRNCSVPLVRLTVGPVPHVASNIAFSANGGAETPSRRIALPIPLGANGST